MKIGPGVSELWGVENRPLPLTWPMVYTTACTTVQAVITIMLRGCNAIQHSLTDACNLKVLKVNLIEQP